MSAWNIKEGPSIPPSATSIAPSPGLVASLSTCRGIQPYTQTWLQYGSGKDTRGPAMRGYRVITPVSVHAFFGKTTLAKAAESDVHRRAFLSLHADRATQVDACNSAISGLIGTLVSSRGCNAGNGKREALRLTGMGGFDRL